MEEDDNIPTGEEDRSIENSGWSTRTRLVLFILLVAVVHTLPVTIFIYCLIAFDLVG